MSENADYSSRHEGFQNGMLQDLKSVGENSRFETDTKPVSHVSHPDFNFAVASGDVTPTEHL